MAHGFDRDYWESHWRQVAGTGGERDIVPNPHLAGEIGDLAPGAALDAGCGEGAEAILLATRGWQVTAVDISGDVLARASQRATRVGGPAERVRWLQADLGTWEPDASFDLVATHYAHPSIAQLAFYERIAGWVAPGGTLLIVGHLHTPGVTGHAGHPPDHASVTAADITARLDVSRWTVVTAQEVARTLTDRDGRVVELHDVVVRASRRA